MRKIYTERENRDHMAQKISDIRRHFSEEDETIQREQENMIPLEHAENDLFGDVEKEAERHLMAEDLRMIINQVSLTKNERRVLEARFFEERERWEVAEELHVSEERVSQLRAAALVRIHRSTYCRSRLRSWLR